MTHPLYPRLRAASESPPAEFAATIRKLAVEARPPHGLPLDGLEPIQIARDMTDEAVPLVLTGSDATHRLEDTYSPHCPVCGKLDPHRREREAMTKALAALIPAPRISKPRMPVMLAVVLALAFGVGFLLGLWIGGMR